MKKTLSVLALLLVASCSAAEDKSLAEKASTDEIVLVKSDDAEMAKAFVKAKSQLEQFLEAWRKPPPGSESFSVKVGIKDGEATEYFWIGGLREESGKFFGTVSNTPQLVTTVSEGEEIQFPKDDIVDWTYLKDGKMVGNFTACVMLKKESEASRKQFQNAYGLECEA